MTTNPVHITHIVAPAEIGGLERVVHALTRGLAARGHAVRVIVMLSRERGDHPFLEPYAGTSIRVDVLRSPGRDYVNEGRQLRALLSEVRTDIVHTHGYYPDVLAGWAARRVGIATVATSHGFSGGGLRNQFYEWLQRRAFRAMTATVAVSRAMAAVLMRSGVPQHRVHVIPNALPATVEDTFLARPEARHLLNHTGDEFVIGWVGRFAVAKGLDTFVDALSLCADLPWTAAIVGDGADRPLAEAAARRGGIYERIRWHGFLPDAARVLRGFDALVMSSRSEGTPIILLEAMAAGVPLVVTRVGGIPDVVSEQHALLAPPEDPAALAAHIRALLQDPAGARMRAGAARARIADYGEAAWLARYEALYETLIRHR